MVVCFVEMCHNVRYELMCVFLAQPTRNEMRVPLGMFLRDGEKERQNAKSTNPTAESLTLFKI